MLVELVLGVLHVPVVVEQGKVESLASLFFYLGPLVHKNFPWHKRKFVGFAEGL